MNKSLKRGTTLELGPNNHTKIVSKKGSLYLYTICNIFTMKEINPSTDHHNQKISQTYAQNNHRKLYKHIDLVAQLRFWIVRRDKTLWPLEVKVRPPTSLIWSIR